MKPGHKHKHEYIDTGEGYKCKFCAKVTPYHDTLEEWDDMWDDNTISDREFWDRYFESFEEWFEEDIEEVINARKVSKKTSR